jgi:hypothetical protein
MSFMRPIPGRGAVVISSASFSIAVLINSTTMSKRITAIRTNLFNAPSATRTASGTANEQDQFLTHGRFASCGDAEAVPTVNGRTKESVHSYAPFH